MSSSDSGQQDRRVNPGESGNQAGARWGLILLLLVAVAVIFFVYRGGLGQGGADAATERRLELTRTALAATENLEAAEADGVWSDLFSQTPDDPAVAMNRAINRVLRVDELSSRATNASLDESEKMAARAELPDAIAAARSAIEDYSKLVDNPVVAMWFNARIDLHEASLLPGSMTKSLRRDVYERLSESIRGVAADEPRGMILGGTLIQVVEQLEDPIDGLPKDLLDDAAATVGALSDQHPDNLYFALRAARLCIDVKDPEAAKYVRRAVNWPSPSSRHFGEKRSQSGSRPTSWSRRSPRRLNRATGPKLKTECCFGSTCSTVPRSSKRIAVERHLIRWTS